MDSSHSRKINTDNRYALIQTLLIPGDIFVSECLRTLINNSFDQWSFDFFLLSLQEYRRVAAQILHWSMPSARKTPLIFYDIW